jgi:hypothetical protein
LRPPPRAGVMQLLRPPADRNAPPPWVARKANNGQCETGYRRAARRHRARLRAPHPRLWTCRSWPFPWPAPWPAKPLQRRPLPGIVVQPRSHRTCLPPLRLRRKRFARPRRASRPQIK